MSTKPAVTAIVLTLLAFPGAAQWDGSLHHVETVEEPIQGEAASPQCSQGVVYDDGFFNDFYSMTASGGATMVMKFDLPAGSVGLDQVCACFSRLSASAPSSMSFEVVVYDDNGPGGRPGTLLGSVAASASSIPIVGSFGLYSVNLSGAGIVLPDTGVYLGVHWPGGQIFLCGDRSSGTAQRANYNSGNNGLSWTNMQTWQFPPRALGIRADPATSTSACAASPTALCLNGGRFRVEATYQAPAGQSGPAQVVKLTDDTGYLWFFGASNVEAVVKVLNACSLNDRFWVFAGGLTNVRTVITVTDTVTGTVKTYTNPQGTAFLPIQDTSAFATCP